MYKNTTAAGALRMQRLAKALEGNNFNVVCLDSKEQVIPALEKLIRKGETVSVGGSMTLFECGVIDWLRGCGCQFHDRYAPGRRPSRRPTFSGEPSPTTSTSPRPTR